MSAAQNVTIVYKSVSFCDDSLLSPVLSRTEHSRLTYTQVQWSVSNIIVIPGLVITSILTTTRIESLITDIDNKCLLHPSAVISVRSNVCIRPEDGYNMSWNMLPM
jgi:hypothetical protein